MTSDMLPSTLTSLEWIIEVTTGACAKPPESAFESTTRSLGLPARIVLELLTLMLLLFGLGLGSSEDLHHLKLVALNHSYYASLEARHSRRQ